MYNIEENELNIYREFLKKILHAHKNGIFDCIKDEFNIINIENIHSLFKYNKYSETGEIIISFTKNNYHSSLNTYKYTLGVQNYNEYIGKELSFLLSTHVDDFEIILYANKSIKENIGYSIRKGNRIIGTFFINARDIKFDTFIGNNTPSYDSIM